ncbi:MAG: hypothetical protein CBD27_00390 [Rhodospirillaceae bacterium TMED167]|nr:hypothetical protein [Rhodospirillaceae bacterium]OUW31126.1 MAG: hypothetical protein CBD27_00390 [Rhodospirillaceae bacterium TMED167]
MDLLEALPIAALLLDDQLTVQGTNQAFRAVWGLDENWLTQCPTYRSVLERLRDHRRLPEQPDFTAYADHMLTRLLALESPQQETLHLPSGAIIVCTATPLPAGLLLTFQDTSEKVSAARYLNEERSTHQSLLDQLEEGLAVFGAHGRLRYHNPAFQDIWTLTSDFGADEPSLAQFLDATRIHLPVHSSWPATRDRLAGKLLGRTAYTVRLYLNDGRALDAANLPLPDGSTVLTYRDCTAASNAQSELQTKAETAIEESRLKSHFMAMLSHEMRTPLTSLSGFAELLARNTFGKLNAKQTDYVEGIASSAQRMLTLLTDVLDLSSLESGQEDLAVDTFAVHAFLISLMAPYETAAREKNILITLDCPADIGWLAADEGRLGRAIRHLLDNALEFTGSGGTITLAAAREDRMLRLTISDTGAGLPKEAVERINQPGSTALQGGAFSGHGLGLTIVKDLVARHGGTVVISSKPNRGTAVVCCLPAA